jgi:hypothetical protein
MRAVLMVRPSCASRSAPSTTRLVIVLSRPCFFSLISCPYTNAGCGALTGGSVDTKFRGTWVPAAAACTSPLKLVIDANMVTFVNGTQRVEYRQLEQCFTCMGRDVDNVTMLSTDTMGDSPFMISLDASKKQASVRTDFSNDKKLGARFPFGAAALKQCP